MALSTKAREAICSVATHGHDSYYPTHEDFFTRLEWVLREHGFAFEDLRYPLIHTSEGRGLLPVVIIGSDQALFDVVFTWYRMPSGVWEMICYPSC